MRNLSNLPRESGAEYPHEGLDNFFTDPNWKQFAFQVAKQVGAYPNRLYFNEYEKLGAIVAFRGSHEAWALNEEAVNYVHCAALEGRISKGYVILAVNNPPRVVSCKPIEEVAASLDGVPRREGNFGNYWWVDERFKTDQSADLTDAPF
jgi:hypothetical protein